ncbi:YihY/virulence factor BrkB family protein [Cryobacterium sp. PAMC25264]|uniref:YihY/virulence factor BrkB family protein n=1 Tax=Cryobacterium sp. PAMC25264 TaxID=2861288 RepID=UPI001C63041A|nr:YihY/virulence factor BrkB family protein [Cryobacterium sp. PAMC25264]QYF73414.1 YihY/virulence factor BrkB family protein [Cryobacterium sp. PAMC25264]
MARNDTSDKQDQAPSPDDPRKPDSPGEVAKPSWKYALRKTVREFTADQCTDLAAALTYYAVLAIFPALIAIISLLGVVGQGERSTDTVLSLINQVAPGGTADVLRDPLEQFSSSPAAGFALVFGIVLAIWSASGYVGAFSRAMNRIYEIEEGRPFWKLRPVQLGVTIVSILLILVMVVILIVSGPVTDAVGSALGLGETVQIVWSIVKWPVVALTAVLIIAILYYATPNAKQPKFRWISMGALIALVTLVVASFLFGLYVTNFSNYDRTYGSLAGVVVFLLWLWIANLALLFGAEFDAELERGRQLQAGIAAEEDIQLPPRDTRKSDKAADKERADVADGRRLREEGARRAKK